MLVHCEVAQRTHKREPSTAQCSMVQWIEEESSEERKLETVQQLTQVGSAGRSVGAGGSASGALAAVNCTWQALLLLTNVSSAKCADLRGCSCIT